MGYNFYKIVMIGFITITPILAAFKDFVIESENDLQRLDVANENVLYDDFFFDDFIDSDDFNTVGSKCEAHGESGRNYDLEANGLTVFEGTINERVFNDIIQYLANAADCQKLQSYLNTRSYEH